MITADIIKKAFPACQNADEWAPVLGQAMAEFEIDNRDRVCSFLAQTGYESGQFNHLVENLFYRTPSRLMTVFPRRFPSESSTLRYLCNERALGNLVYSDKLGNGDESSGDGFTYRGRGLIQLTGRSNYRAASKALKLPLEQEPDLLTHKEVAARSAAWFWAGHGLNALADDHTDDDDLEDFATITSKIVGSSATAPVRYEIYKRLERMLG